jgi:hypothetical protein
MCAEDVDVAMNCSVCSSAAIHRDGIIQCSSRNKNCDRFFVQSTRNSITPQRYVIQFGDPQENCRIIGGYKRASLCFGNEDISGI